MINSEKFIERLEKIITYYSLSASSFAEKVGVQRSSISHILSGRNKPSLEFIMKILSSFPEVELYWLLNGKGTFPSENKKEAPIQDNSTNTIIQKVNSTENKAKAIERIVIFYKDGSFKNFEN